MQRINRGPDGDLISYDLTAKAQAQHQASSMAHAPGSFRASSLQADISRVKDASTAEDAFLSQEIEVCVGACILGRVKSIGFWYVLFYMYILFHVTRERVQPAPTASGISKYSIWEESSPVNKG